MKKNLFSILFCIIATTNFTTTCVAQTNLLYYWSFNITDTTVSNPHTPQYTRPGAGSANIFYYYGTAGYIDFTNPGTSLNAQTPDTSAGWSLRLRTPGDSMIFNMPTTNYTNIQFTYATERSGSGPTPVNIYYTTDGTTFKPTCMADLIDSCVYTVSSTAWQLQTYNFIGDAATSNNPNFAVKISYGDWTGGGNDRFDNVALKGDTTNPSLGINPLSGTTPGYTVAPNPATNTLEISGSEAGAKSIIIRNVTGQVVMTQVATGNVIPVTISNLNNGLYFVTIREIGSGAASTVKFIKE